MTLPPLDWWRTVLLLIPAIGVYTIVLGIVSLISSFVDRSGMFAHRCARWWARAILWTTRVRVERIGQPPTDGAGCIFVANHASLYDIPVLFAALPTELRIIAKATLGHVPFIGWHLRRSGHLLVDRQNPGASIFKKMQRMARQGVSLMVFPEGSRSRDGRVGRFKGGVFLLALETGLSIVPVSVAGTRRVMPRGRLMVQPGVVRVTVHEPISTASLTREDARALAERARDLVASAV